MSLKVSEVELTAGIQPVADLASYDGVHVLIRYDGRPIGWVNIATKGRLALSRWELREAITDQLGAQLLSLVMARSVRQQSSEIDDVPVSVIVCTRDRPRHLEACLDAILTQDYAADEVVVVDNASRDDATARVAAARRVRYVREDRPGLDWARNRGLEEARNAVVAFTDDDARPDAGWLRAIAFTFATTDAAAVTGLVAPAELETQAQIRFELEYGGMGHGFCRRVFHRNGLSHRGLLWASDFGVGANMAFRRDAVKKVGSFDTALDVGTPSGGGGDVEMFHRLVARGYTLVYEPSALVWHLHRRGAADLCRLVFNNGRTMGTYLLTCSRNRTVGRLALLSFFTRQWLRWWLLRRLLRPAGYPRYLVAIELAGTLLSPFFYRAAQARRAAVAAEYVERAEPCGPLERVAI